MGQIVDHTLQDRALILRDHQVVGSVDLVKPGEGVPIAAEQRQPGSVARSIADVLARTDKIGLITSAALHRSVTKDQSNEPCFDGCREDHPDVPTLALRPLREGPDCSIFEHPHQAGHQIVSLGVVGVHAPIEEVQVDAGPADLSIGGERHGTVPDGVSATVLPQLCRGERLSCGPWADSAQFDPTTRRATRDDRLG